MPYLYAPNKSDYTFQLLAETPRTPSVRVVEVVEPPVIYKMSKVIVPIKGNQHQRNLIATYGDTLLHSTDTYSYTIIKDLQYNRESSLKGGYNAINYNTNGTIDYGKYQINTIWFNKFGIIPQILSPIEQESMFDRVIKSHEVVLQQHDIPLTNYNLWMSMHGIGYFINMYKWKVKQ